MPWAARRSVATIHTTGATALLAVTLIGGAPSEAIHIEILEFVAGLPAPRTNNDRGRLMFEWRIDGLDRLLVTPGCYISVV